eukprot:5064244-Pleurochrysis_carterae.AAC.1
MNLSVPRRCEMRSSLCASRNVRVSFLGPSGTNFDAAELRMAKSKFAGTSASRARIPGAHGLLSSRTAEPVFSGDCMSFVR